ncbi:membrane protein [Endozoicomonas montiporae]|uniref:Membrane protein n=2 Tax=Endozoicomonas montiporae TaxID=1027273 RepID=A0A081NBF9_9GAMM|nr:DUF2721 domain-containing protein [Endozoicomonas montiporae]AMO56065.1 hypothetical protein EZMO1_1933 [Endozoicomonas montiporae CL-33]KEQ15782.1 membrane protein [Endozoicomonas montiporae]
MQLTLTTPALLFPAISLLFLSYTNKFLALASLIRTLHAEDQENPDSRIIRGQLENLRRRMKLIKHMQGAGIMSFICCVVVMFLLHLNLFQWGFVLFGLSLLFLLLSLVICLMEIKISIDALELQVQQMDH